MSRTRTRPRRATPRPKSSRCFVGCTIKQLPEHDRHDAARAAWEVNPINRPAMSGVLPASFLAVLTTKYWGNGGVNLSVGFTEQTPADLAARILAHMNAWGEFANVRFSFSQSGAQVRITREQEGYWSYLGTDILRIPKGQPTMCLQGFTMKMPESEFVRVVRHETGHTLGCPHEHMREQIVARIDRAKAIAYFLQTQGWDQQTVVQQVLTPVTEASLMGTPDADEDSIMCYQLPGSITKDGRPIRGGVNFTATDIAFAKQIYPKADAPAPPAAGKRVIVVEGAAKVTVDNVVV